MNWHETCMESSLYFWCCGTSHQYIQEGYPKIPHFVCGSQKTVGVGGTVSPSSSEGRGSLLFLEWETGHLAFLYGQQYIIFA